MPLIDPSILGSLGFLFTQEVAIQQLAGTRNSYGEQIKSWENVVGLEAIACVVFPTGGGEQRRKEGVYARSTHKIMLKGAFPAIKPTMRAVVAGAAYDVLLVETDPLGVKSNLICEVITA